MKRELYFVTIQIEQERDMMAAEEVTSRYRGMMEEKEAALLFVEEVREKLDQLVVVKNELVVAGKAIGERYQDIATLNYDIDDLYC